MRLKVLQKENLQQKTANYQLNQKTPNGRQQQGQNGHTNKSRQCEILNILSQTSVHSQKYLVVVQESALHWIIQVDYCGSGMQLLTLMWFYLYPWNMERKNFGYKMFIDYLQYYLQY